MGEGLVVAVDGGRALRVTTVRERTATTEPVRERDVPPRLTDPAAKAARVMGASSCSLQSPRSFESLNHPPRTKGR
jgi:hypothetical protein